MEIWDDGEGVMEVARVKHSIHEEQDPAEMAEGMVLVYRMILSQEVHVMQERDTVESEPDRKLQMAGETCHHLLESC
jgi:hypothetical protein